MRWKSVETGEAVVEDTAETAVGAKARLSGMAQERALASGIPKLKPNRVSGAGWHRDPSPFRDIALRLRWSAGPTYHGGLPF